MVKKRQEWPEVGDIVIGTVIRIEPYGAYVKLDEYDGKEGFIHISEISSTWVRNIRDYVREKQKVVAKVLRVDKIKNHIDLSLRRVTDQWKRQKVAEWKRAQKAENLLLLAAEKLGKTLDEAYEEAGWKMEDAFGEIYAGFEAALEEGENILLKAGIDEKWAKVLTELAKMYVEIPKVKISGILTLRCAKPNGVEIIKKTLKEAMKAGEAGKDGVKVNIYLAGTPRWRVEVEAKDWETAEEVLKKVVDTALTLIKEEGGEGDFKREPR
ncbi:MAG: translation initiation factor IF-2 subunit alpha [Thermofilum sp. ex4484_82]|nr:MAG: translation initiation factor IF-2 subunit alpha [Thermofilum sp. ex4484_82]OYT38606.1 MAG: translation initiation factor IF-2 subunit alpha [Archaeoglobales archaeon ex4484_92]